MTMTVSPADVDKRFPVPGYYAAVSWPVSQFQTPTLERERVRFDGPYKTMAEATAAAVVEHG